MKTTIRSGIDRAVSMATLMPLICLLIQHSIPLTVGAVMFTFDTSSDNGQSRSGWSDTQGSSVSTQSHFVIPSGGRTAGTVGTEIAWDGVHPSLVFSSPPLQIIGNGQLTLDISGGAGAGAGQLGGELFPNNLNEIPVNSSSDGVLLLGLRDAISNDYVFHYQRPIVQDAWSNINLDFNSFVNSSTYYLDLIDSRHGGWGHLEIDDVSIEAIIVPEPRLSTMLTISLLAIMTILHWRKRKKTVLPPPQWCKVLNRPRIVRRGELARLRNNVRSWEIEKAEKRQLTRPHSKTLRSDFIFWTAIALAATLTAVDRKRTPSSLARH